MALPDMLGAKSATLQPPGLAPGARPYCFTAATTHAHGDFSIGSQSL